MPGDFFGVTCLGIASCGPHPGARVLSAGEPGAHTGLGLPPGSAPAGWGGGYPGAGRQPEPAGPKCPPCSWQPPDALSLVWGTPGHGWPLLSVNPSVLLSLSPYSVCWSGRQQGLCSGGLGLSAVSLQEIPGTLERLWGARESGYGTPSSQCL